MFLSRRRVHARSAGSCLSLLLLVLALSVSAGCASPIEPDDDDYAVTLSDIVLGEGAMATSGRIVTVHYAGWLADDTQPNKKGVEFETSIGRDPLTFILGFGRVIPGWDLGIPTMRVGGIRRLEVPPALAYGSRGSLDGRIPPNATLIFDIELLVVQ